MMMHCHFKFVTGQPYTVFFLESVLGQHVSEEFSGFHYRKGKCTGTSLFQE